MCSSTQSTFAWLGFLLVNAGFISLTAYGAVKLWPLGFCVCGLYTTLLFWLAGRAEVVAPSSSQQQQQQEQQVAGAVYIQTRESAVHSEDNETIDRPIYPSFANLLYALGVIGLAVTGLFLPLNVLPCAHQQDASSDATRETWTTNLAQLPDQVRPWARNDNPFQNNNKNYLAPKRTFSHIQNTTLFRGTTDLVVDNEFDFSSTQTLWAVHSGPDNSLPQEYTQYNPDYFVDIGTAAVCFVEPLSKAPFVVVCSRDGETFQDLSTNTEALSVMGLVHDLFVWKEWLWFKESPFRASGVKIYSLNVMDMNLTCYSELDPSSGRNDDDYKHCLPQKTNRQLSLGIFFASALPMLAVSIALWWKKHVQSKFWTCRLPTVSSNGWHWYHMWRKNHVQSRSRACCLPTVSSNSGGGGGIVTICGGKIMSR